jgi:hypothetical protein
MLSTTGGSGGRVGVGTGVSVGRALIGGVALGGTLVGGRPVGVPAGEAVALAVGAGLGPHALRMGESASRRTKVKVKAEVRVEVRSERMVWLLPGCGRRARF